MYRYAGRQSVLDEIPLLCSDRGRSATEQAQSWPLLLLSHFQPKQTLSLAIVIRGYSWEHARRLNSKLWPLFSDDLLLQFLLCD